MDTSNNNSNNNNNNNNNDFLDRSAQMRLIVTDVACSVVTVSVC